MIRAVGGIAPHNTLYKRSTAIDLLFLLFLFFFKFNANFLCNLFY